MTIKKCILVLLIPFWGFAQQSVQGTFSPSDDFTYAFLYKATPDGADYIDRGQLDSAGHFEIKLDASLQPGIYKIVYAIPPEENNFDFIFNGKETISFNFSYDNGVEFTASEENKLWTSYLKSMEMVNRTISNYYTKNNTDKAGFKAIFKTLSDTQKGYEDLAKDKLVYTFITSNRPYIPSEFEDLSTYSSNLKANYLKHIDFDNMLLQSSSFLVDRVTSYVFATVQTPDNTSYKRLVDELSQALDTSDPKIKSSLLEMVWQRFVDLDNHELANYIAEGYLIELADQSNNKVLAQTLRSYINTSIGAKAPNFEIPLQANFGNGITSLHDLEVSEHYLLIFWSSVCGHCLEELPKVRALVANNPKLKVIAFGLENDTYNWQEEIKKYPDFIHVLGLNKWDNPTVQTYGIAATPTYFVLDNTKIIVAKPYEYKDVEAAIKDL